MLARGVAGAARTGSGAQGGGTKEATVGQVEHSLEVNVPVRIAYNQWTQFESFPRFMEGVESVQQLDDQRLHWRAKIAGKDEEWDAAITEQVPDRVVAWQSTSGAPNGGRVMFEPAGEESTRVSLRMEYEPQGLVENVGDALGFVSRRVDGDLHRFKTFIEARGQSTGAWRGQIEGDQAVGGATEGAAAAGASTAAEGPGLRTGAAAAGTQAASGAAATSGGRTFTVGPTVTVGSGPASGSAAAGATAEGGSASAASGESGAGAVAMSGAAPAGGSAAATFASFSTACGGAAAASAVSGPGGTAGQAGANATGTSGSGNRGADAWTGGAQGAGDMQGGAGMTSGSAAGTEGNLSSSFAESSRSAPPRFGGADSASAIGSGGQFAGTGTTPSGSSGMGVDTSGGEFAGAGSMARTTGGAENLDREHRDNTAWAGGSLGAITGADIAASTGATGNPELAGGFQGNTSGTGYRDTTTTTGADMGGTTPSASSVPGGSTGPDTVGADYSPASGRTRADMNEDVERPVNEG